MHVGRIQSKIIYFIHYSHRDFETDCESDIDEFGPKNRRLRYYKEAMKKVR